MGNKIFLGLRTPQVTLFGQTARCPPPTGLAYVFNAVEQAGWKTVFLDCLAEGYSNYFEDETEGFRITGLPLDEIARRVTEVNPEVLGINLTMLTNHDYVKKLVLEIRKKYEGTIILGSPHSSLMHREILCGSPVERIPVDFVVTGRDLGSGEETTYRFLKTVENGGGSPKKGKNF